jgi:cytochrome b561
VAPPVLLALLMAFFYLVPAGIIHLIVTSLANPAREAWAMPEAAQQWKTRYRVGAFYGLYLNLVLLGIFLVHTLNALVLNRFGCDTRASHLSAAAGNIAQGMSIIFIVGIVALGLFAFAALVWSIGYFVTARRNGWLDPRRRDAVIVHATIVPLAVFLLFIAFGFTRPSLCPGLA